MNKFIKKFLILLFILTNNANTEEINMDNILVLTTNTGIIRIELFEDKAPNHVKRIKQLANEGQYDGVVFHRVIDGFMAQTGDVEFGNSLSNKYNLSKAGSGGSTLPDLKAEFSDTAHNRGVLSMARSADPNSANSQFFIVLDSAPHLDRSYSAFGKVIKGMEFVDMIKKGEDQNGAVTEPDKIISIRSK